MILFQKTALKGRWVKCPVRTFHSAQLNQTLHCSEKSENSQLKVLALAFLFALDVCQAPSSLWFKSSPPGISGTLLSRGSLSNAPHSVSLELLKLLLSISFMTPLIFLPSYFHILLKPPLPKGMHVCMLSHVSHVWLFVTLWTVAHQAPLSMGFSRQEYWSGLPSCTG